MFTLAAAVTLEAGVVLTISGDAIATRVHLSGVLFGATVLAAATALPEVSTALEAVRLKKYELAISDIFGGNAFLPTLFLVATLLSGEAALADARSIDLYLAGLGILVTAVEVAGLLLRPPERVLHMGIDSLSLVMVYLAGMAGAVAVTHR